MAPTESAKKLMETIVAPSPGLAFADFIFLSYFLLFAGLWEYFLPDTDKVP